MPTFDFVVSACCQEADTYEAGEGKEAVWLTARSASFLISVAVKQYYLAIQDCLLPISLRTQLNSKMMTALKSH